MFLDTIFDNVNRLEENKGYWFVRTDSGLYFETFVKNGYIGIGWNEITYKELHDSTQQGVEIKDKIAKNQNSDLTPTQTKSRTTGIFNKLIRFKSLKKGDLVIIPSRLSSRLAFGMIQDDDIYTEIDDLIDCPYHKRRKVKWLEIKNLSQLDNVFYQIIKSRHAICDVKKYENFVDNVTNTLYIKDDFTHYVVNLEIQEDINLMDLLTFINAINELTVAVNKELNLNEDIEKISIKLNLQSPGRIEFKNMGKALILSAAMIASSCGGGSVPNRNSNPDIDTLMQVNRPILDRIDKSMERLKADKERLNKIR